MSEEIESYRRRAEAARRAVEALPHVGWGEPGPVDEETDERWDRGNVLGHTAEMLPLWTAQVREVVEGGRTVIGRDETDLARRRQGIESGREAGEEELLRRIGAGLDDLGALLGSLQPADLDRRLTYRPPRGPAREVDLRYSLEELLVGHVEAHLRQLRELG